MPKLPRLSARDTLRALEHLGFEPVRQQGSHVVLRKQTSDGVLGCVVPMHRELAVGTLRAILRQADVSVDDFLDAVNS